MTVLKKKQSLTPFKFVEERSYEAGGYTITNEDIKTHLDFTKDLKKDHAAGICAGGEIPLISFGPYAKKLVLIDHGTAGLLVAAFKLLLLNNMKPADFQKLMLDGDTKEIVTRTIKLLPRIPRALMSNTLTLGVARNVAPTTFQDCWSAIDEAGLKRLKALIPNITLVHGDIRDLANYGKFDIIYGSNAVADHTGHDMSTPKPPTLLPALTDNGHIIFTGYGSYNFPEFSIEKTTNGGSWVYFLLKRKPAPAALAKAA